METIREIVVFFSQFLVIIMPLFVATLLILLIKILTNKPDNNEISVTSGGINPNISPTKNEFNLYDYSIEKLEECIETKKEMSNSSIRKELEIVREEIIELQEEKESIEEEIVSPEREKETVEEFMESEEIITNTDKYESILTLIDEKFDKFDWKLKHLKTPKDLEKFNYEYEKFKKYKKHAKKRFEEFEKKIVKKTNEIKKKYPDVVIKEEQVVVPIANDKKDEQQEQSTIKESVPAKKDEKINNEQKLEKLKKINTQLKAKKKRVSILEASLFSMITLTNVVNKKKKDKEIKKQPVKASKPKRVEIKTNTEAPITKKKIRLIYKKEESPKGKLQVYKKTTNRPILTRISDFVNKMVILPISTIIRMERTKKLERERLKREKIRTELESMKILKRELQQTKKPVQPIEKVENPKVLMKKKKEKKKIVVKV